MSKPTADFTEQNKRMTPLKVCSCGEVYLRVPESAQFFDDPDMGGYYWDCPACLSTLYVPVRRAA